MGMEKEIEHHLKKETKRLGGICLKWISPGFNGVPDRIVMLNGQICFAETKAPNEKARALQKKVMSQIEAQGQKCVVLDTREDVDRLLTEMMKT